MICCPDFAIVVEKDEHGPANKQEGQNAAK
jgi:hypothetical protein